MAEYAPKPVQIDPPGWQFEFAGATGIVKPADRWTLDVSDANDWFFGPKRGPVSPEQMQSTRRTQWQSLKYPGVS